MSVTHGAQVDVVDQIADELGTDAGTVDQIHAAANRAIGTLRGAWWGPDVEKFAEQWSSQEGLLDQARQRLEQMGRLLHDQAGQQRQTSGDGGGLVPGVGPGGTGPSPLGPGGSGGGDDGESWWHHLLNGLGILPESWDPLHIGGWLGGLVLTGHGVYGPWAQYVKYGGSWLLGDWGLNAVDAAGFAKWENIGMWGNRLGGVLAGGLAAFDEWQHVWDDPDLSTGNKVAQIGTVGVTTGVGAWGGAVVGGEAGAAIGTMICPGIGTAIGGAVGGIIGGFAGSELGHWLGDNIKEGVGDAVDWIGDTAGDIGGAIGDAAGAVGDFAGDVGDAVTFWN